MAQPALGTEQATASGTSIDFTGIPAGTKMIVVSLFAVSTNGTGNLLLRLGDSGGIETTGYVCTITQLTHAGATAVSNVTDGAYITSTRGAATLADAMIILVLEDAGDFTWNIQGTSHVPTTLSNFGNTRKQLSAELDRIRLTTSSGTDTFDNGAVNIQYF